MSINEKYPSIEAPSQYLSTSQPSSTGPRLLDEPLPVILYPRSLRDRTRSPLSPDRFRKVAARYRRLYGKPLYAVPEYQPHPEDVPGEQEDRLPILLKLYPVFFLQQSAPEGLISEQDLPIDSEIHEALPALSSLQA